VFPTIIFLFPPEFKLANIELFLDKRTRFEYFVSTSLFNFTSLFFWSSNLFLNLSF